MTNSRKPGRPPGQTKTKSNILKAAQSLFASEGYDQTTIRHIAAKADIDPALVIHYFASKEQLFIASMAPSQNIPKQIAATLKNGSNETLGLRLASLFVSILETKSTNHIVVGALRSTVRLPGAGLVLKQVLVRPILKVFKDSNLDKPELRATLVQSQLVGLVMTRYILKIEPLASLSTNELIQYLAPTLQRYLTDDLTINGGNV